MFIFRVLLQRRSFVGRAFVVKLMIKRVSRAAVSSRARVTRLRARNNRRPRFTYAEHSRCVDNS